MTMQLHLQWFSDFRVPPGEGRRIGRPHGQGEPPNPKADEPEPVDERVADEIKHARQPSHLSELGVNRNRSVDPQQFRSRAGSGTLPIHRGGAKPRVGKPTTVKPAAGISVPDQDPVRITVPVSGIGSANSKIPTRPTKKGGVKSLGGRLDDGEDPIIHGQ